LRGAGGEERGEEKEWEKSRGRKDLERGGGDLKKGTSIKILRCIYLFWNIAEEQGRSNRMRFRRRQRKYEENKKENLKREVLNE